MWSGVNTAITLACAKGIVMNEDASSLDVNGGHISLTKHLAKDFLRRKALLRGKERPKPRLALKTSKF